MYQLARLLRRETQTARLLPVGLAFLLLALSAVAAPVTTEADLVRAGRRASVHTIDSTLAPGRFDDWIRTLAGKGAHIAWEANDCGEATGNPADSARALPVCIEGIAKRPDGREIHVAIAVGSDGLLTPDPPNLMWASIDSAGVSHDYPTLGALARAVKYGR